MSEKKTGENINRNGLYNTYHTRSYAFLVGVPTFPKVLLVEMSDQTKIDMMTVRFFGDNVVYVPKKLECLLVSGLRGKLKLLVEIKLSELIRKKADGDYEYYHEKMLKAIVQDQISYKFKYVSRLNSNLKIQIYILFEKVRGKRKKDESHLPMVFCDDVKRSLGGVNYCIELKLKSYYKDSKK
mmetsp:Transcript_22051/g.30998  ORF Transcript_22051/g.30998 Transcript_22051/m.30998 type:complete len:183 (-) Transcript_22051:38-586(-)